jgi:formylglycine-generating enzyme required for sulfatase activity
VGSFDGGKSPYGVYDMAGNVWEWVADWYGENYYGKSPDRNPKGPTTTSQDYRVIRGGSWVYVQNNVRSATRKSAWRRDRDVAIGFRCAQDRPN